MNRFRLLTVVVLFSIVPFAVTAQQGDQTVYFNTTYRSVPLDREADFRAFLTEVIKPMVASEVDRGRLTGWYVWRVHYGSDQEHYNYVFSRSGNDLKSIEQTFAGGMDTAARRVHGINAAEIGDRSAGLSRVVKNELWVQSPISVLRRSGKPARWANVEFFRNNSQRDTTRDLLLQNVVAQFQLARMNRGLSSGWAHFSRRFPFDKPDSYDSAEITYYDQFDQILGAGIGQQIWREIRSDESNLGDNLDQLSQTRHYIKRELWEMIDYVQ